MCDLKASPGVNSLLITYRIIMYGYIIIYNTRVRHFWRRRLTSRKKKNLHFTRQLHAFFVQHRVRARTYAMAYYYNAHITAKCIANLVKYSHYTDTRDVRPDYDINNM